jgi:cephalosporin-C deacetylase-like acetyl esterase
LRRSRAAWTAAIATLATLALASPAGAAQITSVFDGTVDCHPDGTIRFCGGDPSTVPTWDGVPIDVNVALPAVPASGNDRRYPLLMMFHGWGGSKLGIGSMRPWAERGYAVFSMSDRGFGESCGATAANRTDPACATGYIRLMDTRYEVRDAQEFAGRLVDERVARPTAIGATGGSYGGGISMALAALRDR